MNNQQEKQAIILIVDDNMVNRTILRDLITVLGHKSEEASSGEEALARIFRKPHPDMILLDIMMPGIDGYDVLDKVKADKFLRLLPVIMITAVDDVESQIRCIEKGADDYILKPFNSVLLRARIDALLEKKRLYEQEQKFNLWLAESYQKLQKAEAARDSLLNMILHDLNNPITVIQGHAQLLVKGVEDKGREVDVVKRAKVIEEATGQLRGLTSQILDVAGLETQSLSVDIEPVSVCRVVEKAVNFYAIDVEQAGGSLSVEGKSQLEVLADKSLLTRLLQNVIVNSIKYTTPHTVPEIKVQIFDDGFKARIEISDNGPGIAPKYHEDVFSKFFRVNGGKKDSIKGLGMGLAFCKLAMEAMSGEIHILSSGRKGTTVVVSLPQPGSSS